MKAPLLFAHSWEEIDSHKKTANRTPCVHARRSSGSSFTGLSPNGTSVESSWPPFLKSPHTRPTPYLMFLLSAHHNLWCRFHLSCPPLSFLLTYKRQEGRDFYPCCSVCLLLTTVPTQCLRLRAGSTNICGRNEWTLDSTSYSYDNIIHEIYMPYPLPSCPAQRRKTS